MSSNIAIKNIYHMLSYAFRGLKETGFDNVSVEEFDNIHDLFAAIIVRGVSNQIKRGLHRDYISKEEALPGLRGQIKVAESIKQLEIIKGQLVCSFDEFTEDSLHNQILKCTMLILLRHGNIKLDTKKSLRKLLQYFNEIREIQPSMIRWDSLKYHRNNASYRMLVGICQLAIKGLLLTTEEGDNRLTTWLQDEEMFRLYQRFVLSYYQLHYPKYLPRSPYIEWNLFEDSNMTYLPKMQTDIVLCWREKELIIDTKCYSHSMQVNFRFNNI